MGKTFALKSKRMVTPNAVVPDGIIVIRDGRIHDVGTQGTIEVPQGCEVIDYGNDILAPGLMDIHCHGIFAGQAGESPEKALTMANFLLKGGTTSFLPTTTVADQTASLAKAIRIQKEEGCKGAEIVGIHMEGPFLEPKKVEGVDTGDDNMPLPNLELLEQILKDGEGGIRIMALSILLPDVDKVVRRLREEGIVVAVAHSKANAAQFAQAMQLGFQHGTHLFNVMTGLHHRRPGVVGGLLTYDGMTCELISDELHIHPWAMDVAIRCKGPDRIALITDLAMAGCPDGEHDLNIFGSHLSVVVKDGVARYKGSNESQDNTLAGSTMLLNVGVRNVIRLGYSMPNAFRMGALTPARIIGVDRFKGSLEITKDADVIVVDDDINVKATYVKGELLYQA